MSDVEVPIGTKEAQLPELAKLSEAHDSMMSIRDFIDWLENNGMGICESNENNDDGEPAYYGIGDTEKVIADYHDIDLKLVEKERVALLDKIRRSS